MDHVAAMRVFVAVVDGHGVAAAARTLSMPLHRDNRLLRKKRIFRCSKFLVSE